MNNIGKIAFIVGLIIAVIGAFGIDASWFGWALVVLGVVVGLMNVSPSETRGFLIAGMALLLSASALNGIPYVGDHIAAVMSNLSLFLGGAVFIVAILSLFQTARD